MLHILSSEDIYLFGGKIVSPDGAVTTSNELYKLSIGNYIEIQHPISYGSPFTVQCDLHFTKCKDCKFALTNGISIFGCF